VGGFGLTQNDHVFYRYAWCLPDKAIATPQSAWVIEMARQLNTAFYPILQSAARGEASLEQYGNQALLALSQLPSDSD